MHLPLVLVPRHGEMPPAPGDAPCPAASLAPRGEHPWVLLLYGTKIKASLSGSDLEKNAIDFLTSGQIFHQI